MSTIQTQEVERIKWQARQELAAEKFRRDVEQEKTRLRQVRPLWHRLFPWRITIERR